MENISVKLQHDACYCLGDNVFTTWPWSSLKVQKGHTYVNIELFQDFDVENSTIKLQLDTGNLWRVIMFTRSFQTLLAWKFKKVTQSSTSNLAEILMSRTSLPVQLQQDAGTFWSNIIFTRSCKMLPFKHDLVQNVRKSNKCQHPPCPRFWFGKYLCKVTTWCIQLLRTYRVHKTTWPWASLKVHKGHMKVNVKFICDFDVDNITINLQHDKTIYWVHRVPDAAHHLSACTPSQWQYPSSLRGLRGKKVSCFQTSRPFFEAFLPVWSTRTDEISSRWRTNTNCNEGPQTVDHVW